MGLYLHPEISRIMKNFLKLYLFSLFFLSNFVIYAQGEDDENGNLQGNDAPNAPINSKLIILLIFGILLAFYAFKRNRKAIQ